MNEEAKTETTRSTLLRISHPQEGNYLGRGLNLSLDGRELKHLKAGRAIVKEIEAGHHKLRADNTYHARTIEFDASRGEQVHFRITNRVGFLGSMIIAVLGAGPMHLVIERAEPVESSSSPPASS